MLRALSSCLDETTLASFAEGRLHGEALVAADDHVAGCARCQDLVLVALSRFTASGGSVDGGTVPLENAPEPRPRVVASEDDPVSVPRGTTIGRYTILDSVGHGGMGHVYAAYDPELDRKIAVKLLRATSHVAEERARAQLLREAKAIAKLSHPNVIAVYDAGTFQGRVFIAMEFVDGLTLQDWLAASPRSKREIVETFMAAGRGLAASHAAGVIHRDFKPRNVMVAKDGSVRVMDFGLAQETADGVSRDGAVLVDVADQPLEPSAAWLTQTGVLMGTPAYMAPEQFAVERTDARTDQFSFCVALYEALYGQRPFAGDTFFELLTAVQAGVVADAPPGSRVPAWLRRVLLRGLQRDPARRFPSMEALLVALGTDPRVRTRRALLGVGVVAAVVAAGLVARNLPGGSRGLCHGGDERLAGVWETGPSAHKEQIRRAFAATGKSYAEQAFSGASRLLDEYAGRWLGMYRDACEATHVRGEQSAEVLDLRMSCLRQRLTAVHALSDVFAVADGETVENAVAAAGALPSVEDCADVPVLKAVIQPPRDQATRARVDQLRSERARLVALGDSGHCREMQALAATLLPQVRATSYAPLVAETTASASLLFNNCVSADQSIEWSREAFVAAVEAHDDKTAVIAATMLSPVLADHGRNLHEAETWQRVGQALLKRIGNPPRLEAWWLVSQGDLLFEEHRYDEALAAFEQARATKERLLGRDHPDVVFSLINIPNTLQVMGRLDEALAVGRATIELATRVLGGEHPFVGKCLNNEGEVLNLLGRHAEARAAFQRSLELLRRSGVDAGSLTYPTTGLGIALLGEGRTDEAIEQLERSVKDRVEGHAAPELVGEARFALARALWSRAAERARATTLAHEARADYAQVGTNAKLVASIDAWLAAHSARP